jgi:hypothetical protein
MVRELNRLDDSERRMLSRSIVDIANGTPATELAVARYKRLTAKAGKAGASLLLGVVTDIASETAKKLLLQ